MIGVNSLFWLINKHFRIQCECVILSFYPQILFLTYISKGVVRSSLKGFWSKHVSPFIRAIPTLIRKDYK